MVFTGNWTKLDLVQRKANRFLIRRRSLRRQNLASMRSSTNLPELTWACNAVERFCDVSMGRQLVVLSMLQQQSANDRLAGVTYSNRLSTSDPEIMQALLHSLQYDPSPSVRLAALDALQRADSGSKALPATARGLVEAFQYQTSPLVQVALVDSFLELRPPGARDLLQKVSNDPGYSPEVRQRAAWGLSLWN